MAEARNTSGIYLMYKQKADTYVEKLVDIVDFPDLRPEAGTLDATTCSNGMHIYVEDIIDAGGAMPFTINYNKEDITKLDALQKAGQELDLAIWIGKNDVISPVPTADDGEFTVSGKINWSANGGSVGAILQGVIRIYPSTDVKWFSEPTYELSPGGFTITFNSKGGDAVAPITAAAGAPITLPTPTNTATPSATFDGWFTDDITFANQFTATTMPAIDTTLFAKWS